MQYLQPRTKLRMGALLLAMFTSLTLIAPATAQATPVANSDALTAISLFGENPSGKTKADGSPWVTPKSNTATRTRVTPQATWAPECPADLDCVAIPAPYVNNNPADPVDWGNYDRANRPADGNKITHILVHDTEGPEPDVIDLFLNPQAYVSCHYVITPDGRVIQMLHTQNIGWHAGNWEINTKSICFEVIGYAADPSSYTPAAKRTITKLAAWLSQKFSIPLDRTYITGHDNVPAQSESRIRGMHLDPGPYFDWAQLFRGLGNPLAQQTSKFGRFSTSGGTQLITLTPNLIPGMEHKELVTGCWPDPESCTPGTPHKANFVYLRMEPRANAPFIADPVMGQGSTFLNNSAARAGFGQKLVLTGLRMKDGGLWLQVQFAGTKGWFFASGRDITALPVSGQYVTPKAGKASVPLYGRPLPELSEYPADFVPPVGSITPQVPLPYNVKAGEKYAVAGTPVQASHYHNWHFDHREPYDQTRFTGASWYLPVWYNGRIYYVRQQDVQLAG